MVEIRRAAVFSSPLPDQSVPDRLFFMSRTSVEAACFGMDPFFFMAIDLDGEHVAHRPPLFPPSCRQ